jgi:hypothetical protein
VREKKQKGNINEVFNKKKREKKRRKKSSKHINRTKSST